MNPDISQAVRQLYDTYPFPPEPLLDEPPPGYNWRWNWQTAYSFCTGMKPTRQDVRILDAGCGTGVGTEYLVHLNPEARVTGIDLSPGALEVARERCQRSGADRVEFQNLSIYDADRLDGEFNLINCVGVLHHLPDPIRGIQALAPKLAPGGFFHIFVYAELGRREIQLMQQAISLLQGDEKEDYEAGVRLGRKMFAALPEDNRIVREDKRRWALENHRDANFADMYLHPQEVDYNVDTLFELIDASGLEFIGFSNPRYWQLDRLLGKDDELIERSKHLSDRQYYRLVELLDPELTHYEFFLGRPPIPKADWTQDETLLAATPELSPCIQGWPDRTIFDGDYQLVSLTDSEHEFLTGCEAGGKTVGKILATVELGLDGVRSLQERQLILLSSESIGG
ncbi:class I SAM-dependent methyltransferase [Oscillatoriales cyanobacterium LEGE 11467]|uniref:Class I SAM-dependent methyltransferase n=1 Tax=Zarconia navalis LEGE 11467 TaxID=1828826 RepID=A0A928Z7N9_9CYAN|nr:class I SAM-dependent methyltransferase [Zarconia navalis]MBE9039654.1 class I SAM-dependent methyltransferase [Zarconia navalis LEGE 11467]